MLTFPPGSKKILKLKVRINRKFAPRSVLFISGVEGGGGSRHTFNLQFLDYKCIQSR